MSNPRTFKVDTPLMHGDDIAAWQHEMLKQFAALDMQCPMQVTGIYDVPTRAYTATLCHCFGLNATEEMKDGVTPELRTKIRHRELTPQETARMQSKEYVEYRRKVRARFAAAHHTGVHRPATKILTHSWGYHPGVHDGVDVIVPPDVPIFAMVKSKVIDVRGSGWWGLGAPKDATLKAKGDGIIQLEVLEDVGPFKKGYHIGYGHAEKAKVSVGQIVEAGRQIGHAGLANAWHIHLMYNDGTVGTRGVGNVNPEPMLEYAIDHG